MYKKIFSLLLAAVLLLAGYASVTSVSAAGATPTPAAPQTTGQNDACRHDLTKAAAALNITEEQLKTALGDPSQERPDMTVVAAKLGVTVDTLRQAMQQARSADCLAPYGQDGQGGPNGQNDACRPDLTKAATALNITAEQLQSVLGDPSQGRPDLAAVAAKLGVTIDALQQAMQQARSADCPAPGGQNGQGDQGGQNDACHPDLTKAAAALNITAEQLQAALGDHSQGRPDLTAVAAKLNVTVDALHLAMQQARSADCPAPGGQGDPQGQGGQSQP